MDIRSQYIQKSLELPREKPFCIEQIMEKERYEVRWGLKLAFGLYKEMFKI